MRFCLFYHSLVSDWNHGNAHFLRGIVSELQSRGHDVRVWEPRRGWSLTNLLREQSRAALEGFRQAFPGLQSATYDAAAFDAHEALDGADVVVVHEWTDAAVMQQIGRHRTRHGHYALLFHDTHHRAVSDPDALARMPLEQFDGVLAFGASLAAQYARLGWGRRVWVWHEAADTRVFRPRPRTEQDGDLVWIGNWGDNERAAELDEFLLEPVRALRLRARVHGVRYPAAARRRLTRAGFDYGGWVPNFSVPEIFARFDVTVHVPRGPYVAMLPGIPTIRPFEALACAIPLVSAPWDDAEGLFRRDDFVMVRNGREMREALTQILRDPAFADALRTRGLETIRARHTCAHRVDELLSVLTLLDVRTNLPAQQEVG